MPLQSLNVVPSAARVHKRAMASAPGSLIRRRVVRNVPVLLVLSGFAGLELVIPLDWTLSLTLTYVCSRNFLLSFGPTGSQLGADLTQVVNLRRRHGDVRKSDVVSISPKTPPPSRRRSAHI